MNFNYDQIEHIGVLTLQGSLIETHAVKLREVLMSTWGKANLIIINLENVTEIDSLCLQTLCTAYRLSLMTNKFFAMTGMSSEIMKTPVENPLLCYSECNAEFPISEFPLKCSTNCLWTSKGGL